MAADVYSFGIIMTEMSIGTPPYYNIDYNLELAYKILRNGLRPEFGKEFLFGWKDPSSCAILFRIIFVTRNLKF
ncbi:10863_t:CDS:2 [Racocetra fulgida]|uniref:10863_t:CDS:1 n=1 Tax=Racocetra fulgida TaxID=60492 RepID=A0A9N8VUX5_9GLOM|nr:10863_t:CDS:2 [Racocetra fulgida]